tara:strand:+ start:179 stop:526 length:348 start_codon:yes stop_codon:yes gene_type:complete
MNYFKNLSEEQNRLNLKSEKVELSMLDDAMKLRDKAVAKSKSALKNVMGALSDLADTTGALEEAIRLTGMAMDRAEDIGADDYVNRAQKIKSDFERVLDKHRKAITDLRNVKSNI